MLVGPIYWTIDLLLPMTRPDVCTWLDGLAISAVWSSAARVGYRRARVPGGRRRLPAASMPCRVGVAGQPGEALLSHPRRDHEFCLSPSFQNSNRTCNVLHVR